MYEYHSYSYSAYIVGLPYDEFFELYEKCIKRKVEKVKQLDDDRLWQLFIMNNEGGTFEDFKKSLKVRQVTNYQNVGDKQREIERLKITLKQLSRDDEDLKVSVLEINEQIQEKESELEKKKVQEEQLFLSYRR